MTGTVLIACMKNEGPFILEWIAYHQSIGISKFIIVTNDCTDGTDLILDRLDEMGIVRHLLNPTMVGIQDKSIQNTAIAYACLHKEFKSAEYVLIIDADEFLNIKTADGTIPGLMAALKFPDAISVNQVAFGSNGVVQLEDRPVTTQFTRRYQYEGKSPAQNPRMFGIKTIARNDPNLFAKFVNHRPILRKGSSDRVVWLDGSGKPMKKEFLELHVRAYPVFWSKTKVEGNSREKLLFSSLKDVGDTHELAVVNHYAVKSLESFIVQGTRGDPAKAVIARDFEYWRKLDRNECKDDTIVKRQMAAQSWLDALHADPVLSDLHGKAVRIHQNIFRIAAKNPEVQALFARCSEHYVQQMQAQLSSNSTSD